ncbi:DUF4199 domain-containing protein [Candidatus Ornithobacterium hominis]|uniref:DUF4199 family protein n=1 Tax=Candidatus Ornithobacterium hominis TaxID=2497989 RepID=UPI0024BCDE95|nr:DUF4199 family protein [Candidatus Ornithobacterium hominis]CAI9429768.1 DUF4199 domain-containing protein [Candidatus Ornithobacterium hominis]
MLKNVILKTALGLYFFCMILFFLVQLFFRDEQIFHFSEFQYLLATSISNAFIITTVFALTAAYNLIYWGKRKTLNFFQTFKLTFSPGAIAGLLALASIFYLFYSVDTSGIQSLLQQYLDYSLLQAQKEGNLEEVKPIINSTAVRETNLLNIRTFTLMSLGVLFFNFSLGIMFSFLWKVKTSK